MNATDDRPIGFARAPGDRQGVSARPDSDISQPWDQDNQAWWDWYVSLADNEADPAGPEERVELPTVAPASIAEAEAELATPYPLSAAAVAFFQTNGSIKLKQVLSPGVVLRLRAEMARLLTAAFGAAPDGGVRDRFLSLEMSWLDNPMMRAFVLSPRIAKICAELLGVSAVRLYHDNLLSKEPGCGRTPWHFDDHHFPLATHDVVTAWIPAQPIPLAMGPLAFAHPIDVWRLVDGVDFSKSDASYDRGVDRIFAQEQVTVDRSPFDIGEVSFHHNLCFHTAAGNRTNLSRMALANTFYVDGARVVDSPTMVSGDWRKFMPGVEPGEVAASPLNPVCWPPPDGR